MSKKDQKDGQTQSREESAMFFLLATASTYKKTLFALTSRPFKPAYLGKRYDTIYTLLPGPGAEKHIMGARPQAGDAQIK